MLQFFFQAVSSVYLHHQQQGSDLTDNKSQNTKKILQKKKFISLVFSSVSLKIETFSSYKKLKLFANVFPTVMI